MCVYLEKTGLEHLEDGVHGVRDAGLAAVAPFVDRVVLGLALRAGDAARISLLNQIMLLSKITIEDLNGHLLVTVICGYRDILGD